MKIYSGVHEADARVQFIQDGVAHIVLEIGRESYGLELETRYMDDLESVVSVLVNRVASGEIPPQLEFLGK